MTGPDGSSALRRRLADSPSSPQDLVDLGLAVFRRRENSAALWLGRATATVEDSAVQFAYAVTTAENGSARRALKRALTLDPTYSSAWVERASRDPEAAIRSLQRAMTIDPADLGLAISLAAVLLERRELAGARTILEAVLAADREQASAWINRGRVAVEEDDWPYGLVCARRAVVLAPAMFEGWLNIGGIFEERGNRDAAVSASVRAVVIEPNHPKARWNRCLTRLGQGDWRKGFADFDVRFLVQQAYPHTLDLPRWDGGALPGHLLVHDEIGYGDVFNFLRYVPLARARVGRLTLEVKPGLRRLLDGYPGIDHVIERGAVPPARSGYDAYLPMESLPGLFATTVETIPPPTPHLMPPPALKAAWAQRLAGSRRPRIGLCWAGNPGSGFDQKRSCRLSDLQPILAVEGLSFVSLQKTPEPVPAPGLLSVGDRFGDFADTAAAISELDLVISVETSVAHLAGAMGQALWILLAPNPAWRWLRDREDTPWYPGARLVRRGPDESWADVTRKVADDLRARFA